ncbi:hypothetical protein AVEN_179303-1 [Araneus ventricosus]|uniref:Uncharacterized protein n=1 Tax=Araneus ventricosus TaxID=182803 RepID=A0A4Y2TU00_ARAVE|nr:hypothetical protein AVEN_179303-1 [Araneus ventricosus]
MRESFGEVAPAGFLEASPRRRGACFTNLSQDERGVLRTVSRISPYSRGPARYEEGRVNITVLTRSGQVYVVTNSARTSAVDELILQNYRITTREIAVDKRRNCASHNPQKAWLRQSLCTVGTQASVRESEDGEMGTGSVSNPGVSKLKSSTPILRAGISV